MRSFLDNKLYKEDIDYVAGLELPWEELKKTKVLITGACGLIGSFLVDVLMRQNKECGLECIVYAMGRNEAAAKERFYGYWNDPFFYFMEHDISSPINDAAKYDYIIHLASNTHPVAYATQPVSTITTNVIGTDHLLRHVSKYGCKRFLFASSNEIYGENRGDVEFFEESYCGYIDPNTLRAGYPESKRCGEALCQAYKKECGIDVVIPRFTRSYGPTLLRSDTKAMSQFIRRAIDGENIVLKSEGNQYYSYSYAADAVSGLLTVLFNGKSGEAYNVSDRKSDIRLKDLAWIIADICGRKVVFEIPDSIEKAGYSTATKARLTGDKLKGLGWEMKYDIRTGVERTITMLLR